MKVIILTQPLETNYGGILQCYALQTVLERRGHKVRVLVEPSGEQYYNIMWFLSLCKRFWKKYFLKRHIQVFYLPHSVTYKHFKRFIRTYIHRHVLKKWSAKIAQEFDCVIVGSDQVWRPKYNHPIDKMFLSFLDKVPIRKVSYAASFGVSHCEYTAKELDTCSRLLKQFYAVSVREVSGVFLCKKFFGVDAKQVLDPTFLLKKQDYVNLLKNEGQELKKKEKILFVYFLDLTEEKKELVEQVSMSGGYIPSWICADTDISPKDFKKMSVENWLQHFNDADFVLTDSFHGCVFSIIFQKQFIVIGNEDRGLDRFVSLLEMFDLNNRMVVSKDEYYIRENELFNEIDYSHVSCKLDFRRIEALNFISNVGL